MLRKNKHHANAVPLLGMALIGCLPAPLKRAYYRSRGAVIGHGVRLGLFSYLHSPELILGDGADIAPFAFVRTRGRCRIGARSQVRMLAAIDTGELEMGEDSVLGEQVTVGGMRTPRSSLRIGDRCRIIAYSFINTTEPVVLEDEVCVGGESAIFTHGTWQSMLDGFPGAFGPVTLRRGAWLGWRSFVMPGITIGQEATVAAAAVVTRDVGGRCMAAGVPARVIKRDSEYISEISPAERHRLLQEWLQGWAEFLCYEGRRAFFAQDGEGCAVEVKGEDMRVSYRWRPELSTHACILLSLEPISEEKRLALNEKGYAWFDINARECRLSAHWLCESLRDYLLRYGLRFRAV